ncbi:MAG: Uma2 family endonuclease [Thermomicrobiales bacterium]
MATTRLYTADDLLVMEGNAFDYELVRGELREVSPAGGDASMTAGVIYVALFPFVTSRGLGYLTTADGGYFLSGNPDTLVAPDVGFIRSARVPVDYDRTSFIPVPPDLAVEVLSPTDRPRDVAEKIALYLEAGVSFVWIVDSRKKTVTVHRSGREPRQLGVGDELDGEDILPGFRLVVAAVFSNVWDA